MMSHPNEVAALIEEAAIAAVGEQAAAIAR
jgi:hypothetical protein